MKVSEEDRLIVSMDVCNNMLDRGYSLSEIQAIMPWLTKIDIFGFSYMMENPVSATDEEVEKIKWEFRRTRSPKILKTVFNTEEEKAKRLFRVNPSCPHCGEEHAYFDIKFSSEELKVLDAFYDQNQEQSNMALFFKKDAPLTVIQNFVYPKCGQSFEGTVNIHQMNKVDYQEHNSLFR